MMHHAYTCGDITVQDQHLNSIGRAKALVFVGNMRVKSTTLTFPSEHNIQIPMHALHHFHFRLLSDGRCMRSAPACGGKVEV